MTPIVRISLGILVTALLAPATDLLAQVPPQITYQGRLFVSGAPVNGTVAMTFRLYAVAAGGSALWTEAQPSVSVTGGVFNVVLGSSTPLSLPFDIPYFLGVAIGTDEEMTPRQPLSSVGYAMRSAVADSASPNSVSGTMIAQGAVTLDKLAPVCNVGDTLVRGGAGWQCTPFCTPGTEACDGRDNDCDGVVDEGWLNGGKYDRNDACGNCITDCTVIYGRPNAQGTCNAVGTPTCVMTCNAGYFDLNGTPLDGCEFHLETDAVYVSTDDPHAANVAGCGDGPFGTGPGRFPCKTISNAIILAVLNGRTRVLVADGRYGEALNLVNGISVLGGFRPDNWERHLSSTTTIIQGASSVGNHDRTVVASGVLMPTVFEGFVVRGSLNAKPGGNSYAIYVSGSNGNLAIQNNVIHAGRSGAGSSGIAGTAGAAGVNGGGRASDPAGYDAKVATGTGNCNASNNRTTLANGGVGMCGGDVVSGGKGGGNQCAPQSNCTCTDSGCTACTFSEFSGLDGLVGQAGAGAGGGAAGAGNDAGDDMVHHTSSMFGEQCYVPAVTFGLDGGNGADAAHGAGVNGCTAAAGLVSGGHWMTAAAAIGIAGSNGGGGGGGGAGAGSFCDGCAALKDNLGGHGGGGGSGGCGGPAGGGGLGGGGVFGVFITGGAAPAVTGNVIVRGEGGAGGPGGTGAAGGQGGIGGVGGTTTVFCADRAGNGGAGGRGGYGSGGGGGCGGASFGIYTSGVGTPNYCLAAANNVISGGVGGPGGVGGLSIVNSSSAGQPGVLGACSFN